MSLEDFNKELREKNLIGYWSIPIRSDESREPEARFAPHLWKWREIFEALHKAAEYIRPEEAYRRFIGFQHPQLTLGTSHTLFLGGQLVRPGEIAPAHRHTMEAVRFVVQGGGASTTVEGERFPMEEGDLITTPNWSWHDHVSAGERPTIWLDGAVAPLIQHLQIGFAELYPQTQQPITRPVGWSEQTYGSVRPQQFLSLPLSPRRSPYRYRWEETEKALTAARDAGAVDPFDGVLLHYADPLTGGPTLPALSCEIQMLNPGERTGAHRHTHTPVYHAFRGRGRTVIGGHSFEWEQGDSFIVPLWNWHRHENRSPEPSILFSISDRPVMEVLGFSREEARD